VSPGTYEVVLNTDSPAFGGFGLTDDSMMHFTVPDRLYAKEKKAWLKLYLPARTAVVVKRV
jgi:1,4-alpha-glucan branching enzyme